VSLGEQRTWEYRIGSGLGVDELNALGAEGWELVAVQDGIFYLKRPGLDFKERVTLEQREHYFAARAGSRAGSGAVKKGGVLHPEITYLLARTGHTDWFTVCDKGFPVPAGPERIDLALVEGIPTVLDVLRAVHAEFAIDRVLIAQEMEEVSPDRAAELRALLGEVPLEAVPHVELKRLSAGGKATIRTGDAVPYANIIVVSG
jgi:D-ribose pyranase